MSRQSGVDTPILASPVPPHLDVDNDVVYPSTIPFVLAHLACIGVVWTGVSTVGVLLLVFLYSVRMFAVTAGYHRYFSHRSYKTSRAGQFILAMLAQSSAQRGVLWWAAKHRAHHRYSDTPQDSHSPRHRGFWFAHVGWIFAIKDGEADYQMVSDLSRYPELVWLDRHRFLPAIVLGILVWLVAGWECLIVGFFMSTVLLYHCTFAINSLAHIVGKKRYLTGDDSRNNWLLALVTFGEGWHNNHHHYQTSTRQGFRWWEIDITYYLLRVLSLLRVVWDLRSPPPHVVRGETQLGRGLLDRLARQLAESFRLDVISAQVLAAWNHNVSLEEIRQGARHKLAELQKMIRGIHLPQVPTLDDLRTRARELFPETPSLEQVVKHAWHLMHEEIFHRLLEDPVGGVAAT